GRLPQDNQKHSVQCILGAPYGFFVHEDQHLEDRIVDIVIKRLERFVPGISKWIEVCCVATPRTLEKYTWNHLGAMYGWASSKAQLGKYDLQSELFGIEGLFLVGHWAGIPTGTNGIPTVVASGKMLARRILRLRSSGQG